MFSFKMRGIASTHILTTDTLNIKCKKIELKYLRLIKESNDSIIFSNFKHKLVEDRDNKIFNFYELKIENYLMPIVDSIIKNNRSNIGNNILIFNLPFKVNNDSSE